VSRQPAQRPRIICVGGNEEARTILTGLLDDGAEVVAVVTHPPGAAEGVSDYADLHGLCAERGVACIDTADINGPETVRAMLASQPDYVFVLGWSQLLGLAALSVPAHYVVGSHPSALPMGRGRAPVPWAILLGERSGAVSLFRMERGADSGPVLGQRHFDIPAGIDAGGLYQLTAANLREAFRDLYAALMEGPVEGVVQDESKATYRARRVSADGHIDFARPREAVDRLVRAVTHPYPGAYTYYRGRRIMVWRSDLTDTPDYVGVPGQILRKSDGRILVSAQDGPLWLSEFSDETRADVDVASFATGDVLGYRVEDTLHRLEERLRRVEADLAELRASIAHG
jgi:methionyl-tRNA formyltransferase